MLALSSISISQRRTTNTYKRSVAFFSLSGSEISINFIAEWSLTNVFLVNFFNFSFLALKDVCETKLYWNDFIYSFHWSDVKTIKQQQLNNNNQQQEKRTKLWRVRLKYVYLSYVYVEQWWIDECVSDGFSLESLKCFHFSNRGNWK